MEDFYTVIKFSPEGMEKMWNFKVEEKARAKFDKEAEKLKETFSDDENLIDEKNKVSVTGHTVEFFKTKFKD